MIFLQKSLDKKCVAVLYLLYQNNIITFEVFQMNHIRLERMKACTVIPFL